MCAGPAADCALPPTGGALRLEHARTSLGLALCVERRGAAALLARPGAPYARLVHGRAQSASGAVKFAADVAAGVSLWSLARACEGTGGGGCDGEEDEARRGGGEGAAAAPVRACVELRPANAPAHALAFDSSSGALRLVRAGSPEAVWYRDDDGGDGTGGGADSLAGTPASEHARAGAQAKAQTRAGGLDRADAVALAAAYERDGYVVVPGACPEGKVSAALRVLNHFLGSANIVEDVEEGAIGSEFAEEGAAPLVKLGSGHRCTCSLAQQAALRDLDERCAEQSAAAAAAAAAAAEIEFETAHREDRTKFWRTRSQVIRQLPAECEFWSHAIGNHDELADYTYHHEIWAAMDFIDDVAMDFPTKGEQRAGEVKITFGDGAKKYFVGDAPFVLSRTATARDAEPDGAADGVGSDGGVQRPPLTEEGEKLFAVECSGGYKNIFEVLFGSTVDAAGEPRVLGALREIWADPVFYYSCKDGDEEEGEDAEESSDMPEPFSNTAADPIVLDDDSDSGAAAGSDGDDSGDDDDLEMMPAPDDSPGGFDGESSEEDDDDEDAEVAEVAAPAGDADSADSDGSDGGEPVFDAEEEEPEDDESPAE